MGRLFYAYQESFDIGKNRDCNFIFGPSQPWTFFVELKLAPVNKKSLGLSSQNK